MLKAKKGFSLIELLVVIAIIGVLSAVGITAYSGYTKDAKIKVTRAQHGQLSSLINAESAKCAGGMGNFAWTAADGTNAEPCSGDWTVDNIIAYANAATGMSMTNAYDQSVFALANTPAPGSTVITLADSDQTVVITTKLEAGSSASTVKTTKIARF